MIFLTLAILAVPISVAQSENDWLAKETAARQIARDQGRPAFQAVMTQWKACLIPQARRMSASRDAADLVAIAALVACSKWEKPIKIGLPAQIALANTSWPFLASMKLAEENIEDNFGTIRAGMKEQIISVVVTQRSNKFHKR